jgi:hypothetical protein
MTYSDIFWSAISLGVIALNACMFISWRRGKGRAAAALAAPKRFAVPSVLSEDECDDIILLALLDCPVVSIARHEAGALLRLRSRGLINFHVEVTAAGRHYARTRA